jgi:hypothetical protein
MTANFLIYNFQYYSLILLYMKIFYRSNCFRGMLKPLATLLLFFALIIGANAQVITVNKIEAPQVVTAIGALDPGVIIGSTVIVTDELGSSCPNINYEWQSATDEFFTENLKTNLAKTKDYDPGVVSATTYFRRVVLVECLSGGGTKSATGGIKITIN